MHCSRENHSQCQFFVWDTAGLFLSCCRPSCDFFHFPFAFFPPSLAVLVVNQGEDWALALTLNLNSTNRRYHRGVTIMEWRKEVPRDALLVPPRFPQRDAMLRVFQQEVWPTKYQRMEWEVVLLDTDEVRAGGRPEVERKCTEFPKLVEGEGGSFLRQELEGKLAEQRRLRGMAVHADRGGGRGGGGGGDPWPSASRMATLALDGVFSSPFGDCNIGPCSELASCVLQVVLILSWRRKCRAPSPAI